MPQLIAGIGIGYITLNPELYEILGSRVLGHWALLGYFGHAHFGHAHGFVGAFQPRDTMTSECQ